MPTKRVFEQTARIIRDALESPGVREDDSRQRINVKLLAVARDFADTYASENGRFDRERFMRACGFEDAQ